MASEDLLKKAVAAFKDLSPEQQAEMLEEQRQSWVRGNVGLSRDERGMTSPAMREVENRLTPLTKAVNSWADRTATPVAHVSPDATGKCGELVTIKVLPGQTELVTRSQAVELLAAERAENTRLQSENDAQADQISELQMTPWPEWATKVLAVIRKRSGYDGYGDAIEGVDLPAELDECIAAIEADNAALTAKLETATSLVTCCCGDPVDAHDMGSGHSPVDQYHYAMMQLEAKLAAAEEVAQLVIQAEEDKSGDPNFYILMMQTAYDKARAVLEAK